MESGASPSHHPARSICGEPRASRLSGASAARLSGASALPPPAFGLRALRLPPARARTSGERGGQGGAGVAPRFPARLSGPGASSAEDASISQTCGKESCWKTPSLWSYRCFLFEDLRSKLRGVMGATMRCLCQHIGRERCRHLGSSRHMRTDATMR